MHGGCLTHVSGYISQGWHHKIKSFIAWDVSIWKHYVYNDRFHCICYYTVAWIHLKVMTSTYILFWREKYVETVLVWNLFCKIYNVNIRPSIHFQKYQCLCSSASTLVGRLHSFNVKIWLQSGFTLMLDDSFWTLHPEDAPSLHITWFCFYSTATWGEGVSEYFRTDHEWKIFLLMLVGGREAENSSWTL